MKLYHYQQEIVDALSSGENVVVAGSRRVGLTTAVLVFIESKLTSGDFKAVIHTRNMRGLLNIIGENIDVLPNVARCLGMKWRDGALLPIHIEVSNASRIADLDIYDDVNLPNEQINNQWILTSSHGICSLPKSHHQPFHFMKGISYTDIPQEESPTADKESNEKKLDL